jgi:hypothetical protein
MKSEDRGALRRCSRLLTGSKSSVSDNTPSDRQSAVSTTRGPKATTQIEDRPDDGLGRYLAPSTAATSAPVRFSVAVLERAGR